MPRERERNTCTECSIRRQKCDRNIPCGRCIKRGVADRCTLRWPDGKYDARVHRVYPSTRKRSRRARRGESNTAPLEEQESNPPNDTILLVGLDAHAAEFDAEDTARANEPRLQYSFIPHQSRLLRKSPSGHKDISWLSLESQGAIFNAAGHETLLQMLLPGMDHVWNLVNYHELSLLWYHGCYHGATFRWELESLITEQDDQATLQIAGVDLQWLALLFSVMAGSLTCATDRRLEEWGFSKSEAAKLSVQWYKATITCLNQAEWTLNHDIYAVHAIATLTMSAHPLGRSSELSVFLGAALKVAQSLGLDILGQNSTMEKVIPSTPMEQRHRLLQREIGRRLWSQLCVQDWMSLPFSESHSINLGHFTTSKPSSRNHLTMDPIPATFPTYISYGNYLFEIARLIVGHHEAMLQSTTQFTKYERVLEYDQRMRTLATKGMPRYFHVVEPIDPSWPEWVIWARRSLTICFAHKIFMIHRAFIRESFVNPAYSMTRMTCLAAAKTILNEAKQTRDFDGPIIWIDKAFCVVAGIILCLDLFHRPQSDNESGTHKALVSECIELLQRYDTSTIATRGANLLSVLLTEREKVTSNLAWPPQSISTSQLFRSLMSETDTPGSTLEPTSVQIPELLPPQAGFCNRFLFENLLRLDNKVPGNAS